MIFADVWWMMFGLIGSCISKAQIPLVLLRHDMSCVSGSYPNMPTAICSHFSVNFRFDSDYFYSESRR